jgi:hypothetical protein
MNTAKSDGTQPNFIMLHTDDKGAHLFVICRIIFSGREANKIIGCNIERF